MTQLENFEALQLGRDLKSWRKSRGSIHSAASSLGIEQDEYTRLEKTGTEVLPEKVGAVLAYLKGPRVPHRYTLCKWMQTYGFTVDKAAGLLKETPDFIQKVIDGIAFLHPDDVRSILRYPLNLKEFLAKDGNANRFI